MNLAKISFLLRTGKRRFFAGLIVVILILAGAYILFIIKRPSSSSMSTSKLEQIAKIYQQSYLQHGPRIVNGEEEEPSSEFFTQTETRIFDLRSEKEYLEGHIRYSSRTTLRLLPRIASQGKLAGKIVVLLVNTGETEELRQAMEVIRRNGAKEAYLYSNFDPSNFPKELIQRIVSP